jgi:phosphate:Na+ symporter
METFHHILKLSAGVGLFLFAIYLLEESLKTFLEVLNFYNALQRMRLAPLPGCDSNWYSSEFHGILYGTLLWGWVFTMRNGYIILGANLEQHLTAG